MTVITELVWLVPIIVGVVEVAKRCGLPTRFSGAAAIAAGIAGAVLVGPEAVSTAELAVAGVATGLAACGLYGAGKAAVTG